MQVTLGRGGLVWDGEEHLVLGAEAHYWRMDRGDWSAVLDTIGALGFTVVSTYVSWSVHEDVAEDGSVSYGFDGPRDIAAFLGMVAERGLKAIVRIGPDTASEQEDSGWSPRVLDDPACWARRPGGESYLLATATGHCSPPSYASSVFMADAHRWYGAIVPVLAPLQHPTGPIVACQVDNELGFHFQAHTFAMDHHPEFVAGWKKFVVAKRGAANPYGTGGIDSVAAPTDGADLPEARRLDWVAYREQHRIDVLTTFAAWARQLGMTEVPLQHNDYPRTTTPMDVGRLERDGAVDWAALDVYTTAPGGRFVRDVARLAAGATKLPFLAELGAGWLTLPWLLPMATTPADEEHVALRALFSGFKVVNAYQLVERDRWYASPVDRHGVARPEKASLYPRLRILLDSIDWLVLERDVRVLVLENRAESRRSAALDTMADIVPCFSQLLPLDPALTRLPDADGGAIAAWERALATVLDTAGVDVDRASTSCLPDLSRYDVVVVPYVKVLEAEASAALASCAARVVAGPADPMVYGIEHMARPDPGAFPAPAIWRSDPEVDLHVWRGGGRTVVAAFESAGTERTFTMSAGGGPLRLVGRWRPEVLDADEVDGSVEVTLPAYGAQVWEVEA